VVDKGPLEDPVATGTPGIGTEDSTVATGSTGGSTGTRGKSQGTRSSAKDPEASGDRHARTELKDAKAATIIMGVCSHPVIQHILLLESAKEQWDTLKKLYAPTGAQQLSSKVQAFTGYKATAGTTVAEIATALSTLQYEIGVIDPGERPTDGLKIGLLFQALRVLDPQYGPLILQLELSNSNKEWESVVAHVTEFERQLELSGSKSATAKALKADAIGYEGASRHDRKPRSSRPFKGYCNNCGRYGHRQLECPEEEDSGSDSAESGISGTKEQVQGPHEAPRKPAEPVEQVGMALATATAW
jgi:hypothetical protein